MIGENNDIIQSQAYAHLAKGIILRDLGQPEESSESFQEANRLAFSQRDTWFDSESTFYSPLASHFVTDTDGDFARIIIANEDQLLAKQRPRQGYIEVKLPTFLFGSRLDWRQITSAFRTDK